MSRATRRLHQVQRLERMAGLQAQAARLRLASAQRAEAETRSVAGRLEARRAAALGAGAAPDSAAAMTTAAWLRWAEQERRRLMTEQAARRAQTLTIRQQNAHLIARHAVLERLLERLHRQRGDLCGAPPAPNRRTSAR